MKRIILIGVVLVLVLVASVAQAGGLTTKSAIEHGALAGIVPLENGDAVVVMVADVRHTIDVIYLRDGSVRDERSLAWGDPANAPHVDVYGCKRTIHLLITEADGWVWYSHYDLPEEVQTVYLPVVCRGGE
jgi:hypothetical protein